MIEAVTEKNTRTYEVIRALATVVFHTLMPVRFHNAERLQKEPPILLIANHQHALDPVAMALAFKKTQVVFLGKKELGKNPWFRKILTRLHCILVDRHNTDMEAMRACMKAIRMKKVLVIFPEGTRHHEGQMEQIENGTSLIALRGRAPVIPMYFDKPLKWFRVTNIYVGEPIPYDDLLAEGINTETCEKMNERMRETYRKMIREVQAGEKKK